MWRCCGKGPFLILPFGLVFVDDESLRLVLLEGGTSVLDEEGSSGIVVAGRNRDGHCVVDRAFAWVATVVGIDGVVNVARKMGPSLWFILGCIFMFI